VPLYPGYPGRREFGVDIIFKGRHTEVLERFRKHALAKLAKIEKLDPNAIAVNVEILAERNPRQSGQKERVELTVISRGPILRAEAGAEDRYVALDMAMAKLEAQLRRALDRRKSRHGAHSAIRLIDLPEAELASDAELPAIRLGAGGGLLAGNGAEAMAAMADAADRADAAEAAELAGSGDAAEAGVPAQAGGQAEAGGQAPAAGGQDDRGDLVAVEMEGDGPLIVREKFHAAVPMCIEQALFEMELVGHDFFLFTDEKTSLPSVIYRRRGYQYGVIRLVEELIGGPAVAAPASQAVSSQPGAAASSRPGPAAARPGPAAARPGPAGARPGPAAARSGPAAASPLAGRSAANGGRGRPAVAGD
jgi:ribosomal subunit interface protein